ncbi:chloramphenicol phosphotransferase [Rhizobium ruizarguesonis]|jgi:chloramphenicol 3-O phosphotransferase|uniref:Chloramphenicol phosphotransferase n=1 Tax=Rhizobium ruizarguesonis TaxID=2081791 RepID=A0AAE4YWL6_9HYPH|nr:chloramphenicol phosphotransferase [Rhizobium ruizarguesonis]MBY5855595.1 chloramphenicol phosphotransferase [Rhizobium leguminosarum]NKJ77530.1 chloramphenicol phosphotransferase [Rhizobium leguminosarum bv. viciae]QIO44711.1 chloramphenicol phosphotransferase [Rhizobium leguminosarum bv. trifolii]NEI51994.1 chloramphenicol phosphotransferase [Rhizobium ruizarguesonis]NKQ72749.1 chloramphenicol phosphotransferase [Rhizobium ruizarguesonis]
MTDDSHSVQIIILNGAPRSGKSSIARAVQEHFEGPWINLGVDSYNAMTPKRYLPGIGLRPGGERPDLEELVPFFYAALYESIAIHASLGLNVIADLGHHDSYSQPLGILGDCARRLEDFPVLFVGVRCPIETIMQRRDIAQEGRETLYLSATEDVPVPEPVQRWQDEVHRPGIYDMEVDTSVLTPLECAEAIRHQLDLGIPEPSAFERIAGAR